MVTPEDFNDDAVEACRCVMIEVLTILGKHRDQLVIVGGWVPPLLFGRGDHIGSIDVDLAVDAGTLPNYIYETIARELSAHGYRNDPHGPPARFLRDVERSGRTFTIRIDLLTSLEEGSAAAGHRLIQGLPIWCAGGIDVALQHSVTTTVSGTLPDGGVNSIQVRVASAAALITMKGIALDERLKEKDAYDIYYCLRHFPGGITALAEQLRPVASNPTVGRALRCLREKFSTIDSIGPVWAARILEAHGGDYEISRRDAFERAKLLLDSLNV